MLSPRTISLRAQCKALLKVLDTVSNHKTCSQRNVDGIYNEEIDLESSVLYEYINVDSTPPINLPFLEQPSEQIDEKREGNRLDETEITHQKSVDSSFSLKISDKSHQKVPSKIQSPRSLSSEIKFISQGISSELDKSNKQLNMFRQPSPLHGESRSQISNTRERRSKPICLEQQRAAEAQMHAPTHAHSTSKCYCTSDNYSPVQPDKKYIVHLYSKKQHIPNRLMKERYRTDTILRQLRSVRWADCGKHSIPRVSQVEEAVELPPLDLLQVHNNCKYSSPMSSSRCSVYGSHKSCTKFVDKVKSFRESHWSDCHASSTEQSLQSNHECALHYVLNRRLFLDPSHIDDRGEESCPVCFLPSRSLDKPSENIEGLQAHSNLDEPRKKVNILVTLPKAVLEPDSIKEKLDPHLFTKKKEMAKPIPKRENTAVYPTDSLALRYQRKMC